METRLGFVGIIIEDRQKSAQEVNRILSQFASSIICRTGVPYQEKQVSVITLIVDTTTDVLGSLTGRLGALPGVSVKSNLSKK